MGGRPACVREWTASRCGLRRRTAVAAASRAGRAGSRVGDIAGGCFGSLEAQRRASDLRRSRPRSVRTRKLLGVNAVPCRRASKRSGFLSDGSARTAREYWQADRAGAERVLLAIPVAWGELEWHRRAAPFSGLSRTRPRAAARRVWIH